MTVRPFDARAVAARPATAVALSAFLILLLVSSANAQRGAEKAAERAAEKAAREAKIKALEEQIHQLKEQEKATLKAIDERFEHIIQHLDPKEVHGQLEEGVKVLQHIHEILAHADHDYGGHKKAAEESVNVAEQQLKAAVKHDTPEERSKAAEALAAAHKDLSEALAYSLQHPGEGKKGKEPESQAASNQQLAEAITQIENIHRLLGAVNHEITDYKQEKKDLLKKRDELKKETKEQFLAQIKQLEEQIKSLKK